MLIQVENKQTEAQEYQSWIDAIYNMAMDRQAEEKIKYARQRRIELGRSNMHKAGYVEGLGQLVAEYDPEMWFYAHFTDNYHWQDEGSIKQYKKDNPEVLVTK